MDPLTHTLVGASLAQTRFGRVRFGTATLVVGANLPDLDAATYFFDSQLSLGFRRGWTHGVLAMALLPALLGWVMGQVDRFRCRRDPTTTPGMCSMSWPRADASRAASSSKSPALLKAEESTSRLPARSTTMWS